MFHGERPLRGVRAACPCSAGASPWAARWEQAGFQGSTTVCSLYQRMLVSRFEQTLANFCITQNKRTRFKHLCSAADFLLACANFILFLFIYPSIHSFLFLELMDIYRPLPPRCWIKSVSTMPGWFCLLVHSTENERCLFKFPKHLCLNERWPLQMWPSPCVPSMHCWGDGQHMA